jgi:arabinose-5-phosphate isomerase
MPRRPPPTPRSTLAWAKTVLVAESRAIAALPAKLGADFLRAVDLVERCRGRVVTLGMGKPGFIAQKVSATLASIGVPSHFLHPAEAAHGDLGRLASTDTLVAFSNSGATEEVVRLLPTLKRLNLPLIALTGESRSPLAKAAHVVLEVGVIDEACPMGLVPTASSAALHAMGDALAMTVAWRRGITREAYARLHPGGSLGRAALQVADVMRSGPANPLVAQQAPLSQAVRVMTQTPGRPGAVSVIDGRSRLVGFFTDGDLRRLAEAGHVDFTQPIKAVMTAKPRVVRPDDWVADAAQLLRRLRIDQVPVVEAHKPVGLLDVQDLLAARAL